MSASIARVTRAARQLAERAPAPAAPEPDALTIAAGGMSAMRAAADAGDDAALTALERSASWSANTRRAYARAWSGWSAWSAAHAAPPLPARARDVRAYLLSRSAAGRSMGTLRADAAGIAAVHRAAGQASPCEPRGVVSATLARLAKSEPHAHAPRQVDGLTAEALAAIQAVACQPRQHGKRRESADAADKRGRVDIALCCLLSDAGLRRSEAAALTWADISREPDGSGRVTVRRSKTDQEGAGAVVAVTPGAMAALDAMRHGAPDAAAVFGLRADTLARRVKAAARAAGLGSEFSGHSGRVGCARRMTAAGAPTAAVQHQGRWKSPAMVSRYTRGEAAGAALKYL